MQYELTQWTKLRYGLLLLMLQNSKVMNRKIYIATQLDKKNKKINIEKQYYGVNIRESLNLAYKAITTINGKSEKVFDIS